MDLDVEATRVTRAAADELDALGAALYRDTAGGAGIVGYECRHRSLDTTPAQGAGDTHTARRAGRTKCGDGTAQQPHIAQSCHDTDATMPTALRGGELVEGNVRNTWCEAPPLPPCSPESNRHEIGRSAIRVAIEPIYHRQHEIEGRLDARDIAIGRCTSGWRTSTT